VFFAITLSSFVPMPRPAEYGGSKNGGLRSLARSTGSAAWTLWAIRMPVRWRDHCRWWWALPRRQQRQFPNHFDY